MNNRTLRRVRARALVRARVGTDEGLVALGSKVVVMVLSAGSLLSQFVIDLGVDLFQALFQIRLRTGLPSFGKVVDSFKMRVTDLRGRVGQQLATGVHVEERLEPFVDFQFRVGE